jgi:acid-sensing ion channel 4
MCQGDASGSKSRPGSLAEAGKLFLKYTTLHGLRHVFLSGSYPRRVAWLLAFLAALALLFTWSSNRVRYLLSSPVHTKAHMIYAKRLVFPAVTICNINRFRFSALTDADIYHLANLTGLPPKNKDGHRPTDLEYPAPDMQDIFNRTGHQLEEMLMSCNFSGQNCSVDDFSVVSALQSFSKVVSLFV